MKFKKNIKKYSLPLRILLLVAILVIIEQMRYLPYLNLVLSTWRIIILIWIVVIVVLRLSSKVSYIFSLLLLLLTFILVITDRQYRAEELAIILFIVFGVGVFQDLFDYLRIIRKQNMIK